MYDLGKLNKVEDLRTVWPNEASDFTNWLAEEENLEMLANEIGIDIELISTEAKTGTFSTDILANEVNTDKKIVIENQLEATNHDHLGKIITYASGHDAQTIIWVVKNVREEHRRAVDWLNEHTDDEINIFLCKIELWKIDDSKSAPKFQIISSPNNWAKAIKKGETKELSSTQKLQLNYWTELSGHLKENSNILRAVTPRPQHWYNLAIGSSLAHITLTINTQTKEVLTQLWIADNKELFDHLYKQGPEIENEIGEKLDWNKNDEIKRSTILLTKSVDITNQETWQEAIEWQVKNAEKFYSAFSKRIKNFNPSN